MTVRSSPPHKRVRTMPQVYFRHRSVANASTLLAAIAPPVGSIPETYSARLGHRPPQEPLPQCASAVSSRVERSPPYLESRRARYARPDLQNTRPTPRATRLPKTGRRPASVRHGDPGFAVDDPRTLGRAPWERRRR